LTHELDLYNLKMGLYSKIKLKFLGQGFQKLKHEQDKQTHRQTDRSLAMPGID